MEKNGYRVGGNSAAHTTLTDRISQGGTPVGCSTLPCGTTNFTLPLNKPNPQLEQYFLSNPDKINTLVRAAGIEVGDRVLELGAGIGSVATALPVCRQLTLLEFDPQLAQHLQRHFPMAQVIQGDALHYLPQLSFDVLLSNLPDELTEAVLQQLSSQVFRVALIAVAEQRSLTHWQSHFVLDEIACLLTEDFTPPQPFNSRVWRLLPR